MRVKLSSQSGRRLGKALLALFLLAGSACRSLPEIPPDLSNPGPTREVPSREGAFAVFGDPQQSPVLDWFMKSGSKYRLAARDHLKSLDPDLILLAGDITAFGCVEGYWKQFHTEFDGMPIYPALGNHDLMGPQGRALTLYFRSFPNVARRRWYEIRHDGIAFLMLDSNDGKMTREDWKAQCDWLRERLAEADSDDLVRGVALVTHHPPFSASWGSGNQKVKSDFYDVAAGYRKFRLYFCGHHHNYQHLKDGERHIFVTGGGGGPLFNSPSGRAGGATLVFGQKIHHVLYARPCREGLAVEMHGLNSKMGWELEERVVVPLGDGGRLPSGP